MRPFLNDAFEIRLTRLVFSLKNYNIKLSDVVNAASRWLPEHHLTPISIYQMEPQCHVTAKEDQYIDEVGIAIDASIVG